MGHGCAFSLLLHRGEGVGKEGEMEEGLLRELDLLQVEGEAVQVLMHDESNEQYGEREGEKVEGPKGKMNEFLNK